jgi:hypothetical protein
MAGGWLPARYVSIILDTDRKVRPAPAGNPSAYSRIRTGTRNDELISRMFDRLHQPVLRFNWSIQAGNALYHPLSHEGRVERAETRPSRFDDADLNASAFIRVERQTLRKLPVSGDILFTIRIYLDPLGWIARHPDRAKVAASFAAQLKTLNIEQLDYKGLTADRDRLVQALENMG